MCVDKDGKIKDVIIEYTEVGNNARGESYIAKCKSGEYDHTVSYKEYGSKLRCSNMLCSRGWIDIGFDIHKAICSDKDVTEGVTECTAPEKSKQKYGIHKTCGNRIYFRLTLKR